MNVTTLAAGQRPQGAHAMSIAPDHARQNTAPHYRAMRDISTGCSTALQASSRSPRKESSTT